MRTALNGSLLLALSLAVGLSAQAQSTENGVGLVQLGQHSDDAVKDRQRQIKEELKHHDVSKADRGALKAESRKLDVEKQGNAIIGGYLRRLDGVGQRNGLQLSDITVSADPRRDFAGLGLTSEQLNNVAAPITNGFVMNRDGPIYVPTGSVLYRNSFGNTEFEDFGGAVLRHEQTHTQGGGEFLAYTVQQNVFHLFKGDFQPGNFQNLDEQLRASIERNREE